MNLKADTACSPTIAINVVRVREPAPPSGEEGVEWNVLRTCGRVKLNANPTAREAYLAIAALGGYIKNKNDPGWATLAYGVERLETLTEGWLAAKNTVQQ